MTSTDGLRRRALVVNKIRRILDVVAVRAPGFANHRKTLVSDLAVLTGGHVITLEAGYSLHNIAISSLGCACYIIVEKEFPTIISDVNKSKVLVRSEQLSRQLEMSDSIYEKEKIKEKVNKLSGGATEAEMKDRKLKPEDAYKSSC